MTARTVEIPIEVVQDAVALLTMPVADRREAFNTGAEARVIDALRYALASAEQPPAIGQPSGIECNGCGDELAVGVPHLCDVLGTIVRVDPIPS